MLLVHTSSFQLSHPIKALTFDQPLSTAAFHKKLDDSCACWENQSLISLSSEGSEDCDTCHHSTRWGCKASRVEAGSFFSYREFQNFIILALPLDKWQVVPDVDCPGPRLSHPKRQLNQIRSWMLIASLNVFCIIKFLNFLHYPFVLLKECHSYY